MFGRIEKITTGSSKVGVIPGVNKIKTAEI
jgi:hypothetical protein